MEAVYVYAAILTGVFTSSPGMLWLWLYKGLGLGLRTPTCTGGQAPFTSLLFRSLPLDWLLKSWPARTQVRAESGDRKAVSRPVLLT